MKFYLLVLKSHVLMMLCLFVVTAYAWHRPVPSTLPENLPDSTEHVRCLCERGELIAVEGEGPPRRAVLYGCKRFCRRFRIYGW